MTSRMWLLMPGFYAISPHVRVFGLVFPPLSTRKEKRWRDHGGDAAAATRVAAAWPQ